MRSHSRRDVLYGLALGAAAGLTMPGRTRAQGLPQRVNFPSADKRTTLVGYVFAPTQRRQGAVPAVVMMHGRAGAYSSLARGVYDASTLSKRHKAWGNIWADKGYVAIMVDGFGPRGYPKGFPRFSYNNRPEELDEVNVRPLDAYGALAYLRSRPDVAANRIGLMGWSNGGSATIAAMEDGGPFGLRSPADGFRAALAFYPACGLKGAFNESGYRPYAPLIMLHGSADEEVSATRCQTFAQSSRNQGGNIEFWLYPGATHSFDDPGTRRQRVAANAAATNDAIPRAEKFFARYLTTNN
jgi:dienelactone hydrolase